MKFRSLATVLILAVSASAKLAAEETNATGSGRTPPPPLVELRTASDLTAEGDGHLKAGRLDNAITSYRAALAKAPSQKDIREKLAQALLKAGHRTAAAHEFEWLARDGNNPAALLALVNARREAGALTEAASLAAQGLRANPGNEELALVQADILLTLKDPEGALGALRNIRSSPRAELLSARAHEAAGRWGQAYPIYKALAVSNPSRENAAAVQRMAGHAAKIAGLLAFPPKGWVVLPSSTGLLQTDSGIEATLVSQPGASPGESARAAVLAGVPEAFRGAPGSELETALAAKLQEHKAGASGHQSDVSAQDLEAYASHLNAPAVAVVVQALPQGAALACSGPGPAATGMVLPPPSCALALPGVPLALLTNGVPAEVARNALQSLATTTILRE